jgi:type I restriction enzyme S subunit
MHIPPPAEQAAIVRFLDWANGRLERAIQAKRKVVALLNEQKQAIIHRAVTRGVNSSFPLKSSGIPWLGDVPKHWDVMTLGRVISDGPKNGISPPVSDQGTIESFSISAVRRGKVDIRAVDKKLVVGDKTTLEKAYGLLRGDILLVRGNGNIKFVGRAGVVEHDIPGRIYPDLLMRIRLNARCVPEYLVALLNSPTGRDQIETAAKTAVGTFKVNNQQIRRLSFALPPVEEQRKILERIAVDIRPTERAEHFAEAQMNLLREYRRRLVADVVTGKLDVRDAAARLSDEAPPSTADDATDLSDEPEAADEEAVV